MSGYDLYGNFYESDRDALNAEDAQCAAIDARSRRPQERSDIDIQQKKISSLMEELEILKLRVTELENKHAPKPQR